MMENLIDSNENSRRCMLEDEHTHKTATNNNNNNNNESPVFGQSSTVTPPARCMGVNCVNGSDSEVNVSPSSLPPFHNEGLIEEIFLLPNGVLSDDEGSSQSDNCVYAYRGGADMESPEPPQVKIKFFENGPFFKIMNFLGST